ncbi:MAG TPA: hypothetical protein VGC99_20580 [Candidatus Tectomicrobia bacterium]
MMLSLTVFDCQVTIQCEDADTRALLVANYGHLQGPLQRGGLRYIVSRPRRQSGAATFAIFRSGHVPLMAADAAAFLFLFEKDLMVALQHMRRDLYFVHAGVLTFRRRAFMLVGPSGRGKSTLTWALLHHGCRYFSDELAAIDLRTRAVWPYPHAICLKQEPPPAYPLPAQIIRTSQTLHIPVDRLPGGVGCESAPLIAAFFLPDRRETCHPALQLLGKAAATAHLLANALNPLAHPEAGLDEALMLMAGMVPFALRAADLTATCALVREALDKLTPP